jgi:hypothetical protein
MFRVILFALLLAAYPARAADREPLIGKDGSPIVDCLAPITARSCVVVDDPRNMQYLRRDNIVGEVCAKNSSYEVCAAFLVECPDPKKPCPKWRFDFRQCHVRAPLAMLDHGWSDEVALDLDDIRKIQKSIPDLKKCEAWHKCLRDRDDGKVKALLRK